MFREELHYNYLGKLQYGKNRQAMDNGVKNSPVIESELRSFLSREGSSYTDFQIEEAIRLVNDHRCTQRCPSSDGRQRASGCSVKY